MGMKVTLHHHEACDPVAWPETLVSLPAALPLCSFDGHHSLEKAFPKSSLPMASFSSEPFVFLSFLFCSNC